MWRPAWTARVSIFISTTVAFAGEKTNAGRKCVEWPTHPENDVEFHLFFSAI